MKYVLWITAICFLTIGLFGGMIIQQGITQATLIKVASNMDGVSVDVHFNESKLVEATKNNIVPEFKEIINNSIMANFIGCTPTPCECWEWGCTLYCMDCSNQN